MLDIGVVLWTALWVVLGVVAFVEVRGLRSLSDTMSLGGQSLQNAANALSTVALVPFVGGSVRSTAQEVQRLATKTVAEAQDSRTHIDSLSWLILIMGGVIPIICGWVVWILLRRSWTAPDGGRAAEPDGSPGPA
jgi:hypothetical protein